MPFLVILLICAVLGFALKGLMLALMHPKMALIIVAAGAGILVLIVGGWRRDFDAYGQA